MSVFPQVPRGLLATLEQMDTKDMPGPLADQVLRGPHQTIVRQGHLITWALQALRDLVALKDLVALAVIVYLFFFLDAFICFALVISCVEQSV